MSLSSSFGLDPAIEARFRAAGPIFDSTVVAPTRALFADRIDRTLPQDGRRVDDVRYGAHERQRLDICSPPGSDMPVVLFIPGGGLTGGDKAVYAHIPAFFARQGFVGVSANYRLAPDFLFPSGAEDVAAVIDWLVENITDHGGDPTRIFVIGQSAGAIHAASALFDRRIASRHLGAVRAAILISGIYEIFPDHEVANINLYFGNDADELKKRSVVNHVSSTELPVITMVCELEPGYFGLSAMALASALTRRDGRPAQLLWLKGHNHLSPVLNMGGPGDELGPAIAEALRAYC